MKTKKPTVALAVVCVDYRMHHPKSNFMEELYTFLGVDKIYVVSYPGPDGLIENHSHVADRVHLEGDISRTLTVLKEHDIDDVKKVLVSHTFCAGHEVTEKCHCEHTKDMASTLKNELACTDDFKPLIALKGEDDYHWTITEV
jgi:hypothetical protein